MFWIFLTSGLFLGAGEIIIDDPSACVSEAALREKLEKTLSNQKEMDWFVTGRSSVQGTEVRVRAVNSKSGVFEFDRLFHFKTKECVDAPALVHLVIKNFLEGKTDTVKPEDGLKKNNTSLTVTTSTKSNSGGVEASNAQDDSGWSIHIAGLIEPEGPQVLGEGGLFFITKNQHLFGFLLRSGPALDVGSGQYFLADALLGFGHEFLYTSGSWNLGFRGEGRIGITFLRGLYFAQNRTSVQPVGELVFSPGLYLDNIRVGCWFMGFPFSNVVTADNGQTEQRLPHFRMGLGVDITM